MPKITDPDLLNQNTEVQFITGSKLIRLNAVGNITASEGVSMQALYSFIKEEWRNDNNLIKFPFPMEAITSEQFDFINGWDLSGSLAGVSSSKAMIRDAGWSKKNSAGNSIEEYMNITTLGSYAAGTDQAYYLQKNSLTGSVSSSVYVGPMNEPVLIYFSASGTVSNLRDYFSVYLREQGKTYGIYNLINEQNITALTYRKYALPLASATDTKITNADSVISSSSPYTGMSITYYTGSVQRTIGSNNYDFRVIINGNNGTAEQIYEFVQYQLRRATDIDSGSQYPAINGNIAEPLLQFVGDTLKTLPVTVNGTSSGVYIDNFLAADTNRLQFTDNTGTVRTFPYVAAGTIQFNNNLSNDAAARYFAFFTNDDAGDNTGRDFGTQNAIIIQDNNDALITGSVNGSSSRAFTYDYDFNIQRGNASSGSDAPYTAVALGLNTAQYVVTTGTITRSTANLISFVAALERNYSNT